MSNLSPENFEGIVVGISKYPRLLSGLAECKKCHWSIVLEGTPNNPAKVPRKCKGECKQYTVGLKEFNAPLFSCLRLKPAHDSGPTITAYVDAKLMNGLPDKLFGMHLVIRGERGFGNEGHFIIATGDNCRVSLVEEEAKGYRRLEEQATELHAKLYQGAKAGRKNESEVLKLIETMGDMGGEASRADLARVLGCSDKTIGRRIAGIYSVIELIDRSLWNVSEEVPASRYPPAFEVERWQKTRLTAFGQILHEIIKRVKKSESREKAKLK